MRARRTSSCSRSAAAIAAALALALAAPGAGAQAPQPDAPAPAAAPGPTRSQEFFRDLLLGDAATSKDVKAGLRGGWFVNPTVTFADLTGDGKSDAVVRVASGGTAGDVALYVFSTDGARSRDAKLRAVLRRQALFRASVRVRGATLTYRVPRYAPGDDLCCPAKLLERDLRWDRARRAFRVRVTREIEGPAADDGDTPPASR